MRLRRVKIRSYEGLLQFFYLSLSIGSGRTFSTFMPLASRCPDCAMANTPMVQPILETCIYAEHDAG
jgi:hypothetical protein